MIRRPAFQISQDGMMNTRIVIGLAGLIAIALAVVLFMTLGQSGDDAVSTSGVAATQTDDADGEENPVPRAPIPIAVHVLSEGRAEGAVRAWGSIRPHREATILSDLTGRVASVKVTLGDAVSKGQILLEIDPQLYLARTTEAESKLRSAELAEEKAKKDLDRSEAMFERETVSDSEVESARTRFAEAQAFRAEAQATLAGARKNLSGARLGAPFAGTVASRPPDVGSSVNIGMLLVSLVDIRSLRVEALLSEQDLARVQQGDEASISVDSVPDRVFVGRVTAIGPQTDATTKQFPVEIEVENPPGQPLRGGMVGRVEIVYEAHDNVPLLPVDALLETDDGYAVFMVKSGVAHRRILTLGPRQQDHVAVLKGVATGDSVVVLGQLRLEEGSAVSTEEVN